MNSRRLRFMVPRLIVHQQLIFLALLVACSHQGLSKETPNALPTAELIPEYILDLQPRPSSQLTMEWFITDLMNGQGTAVYEGSRPIDRVGYRSNICILLNVVPLLQSGDHIVEYEDALKRSSLYLENFRLEAEPDPYWSHNETLGSHPRIGPDTFSGAPFWLCWPAKISPGVHHVTYQFTQSDGTLKEFSWFFEIIK